MGRGSSKISGGGGSGASGPAAGELNTTETLSALDNVLDTVSDPFEALGQVYDILGQSMVGTQFVMDDGKNWIYEFTKVENGPNGNWDVKMAHTKNELYDVKASRDSINMVSGEVVNCLYKLSMGV